MTVPPSVAVPLTAVLLAPVKEVLAQRVARLEGSREARDILTDRTYPFCFWDPTAMAATVGRAALSRVSR